jgi:adenylate cyclase class 2
MATTYEVEVKIPLADEKSIERVILEAGGRRLNSEIQTDTYFDHPCRSFSLTDEAVRLRSRASLDDISPDLPRIPQIELTYKGPKVDKTTKTRQEYTSGVSDIEMVTVILDRIGFKQVATIKKRRVFFDIDGTTASIDDIEGLGLFLELERIADSEDSMRSERTRILSLVERLGLDPQEMVRESYLELYLAKTG